MYKRFKPDYTNVCDHLDILDTVHLYKKKINSENCKWIDVSAKEGIYLLQKIINSRPPHKPIMLILNDNGIVVSDLFKSINEKSIVDKLKHCLIIESKFYNAKYFNPF